MILVLGVSVNIESSFRTSPVLTWNMWTLHSDAWSHEGDFESERGDRL
jgi:hypothetical protein